jgi:hypothetical protein
MAARRLASMRDVQAALDAINTLPATPLRRAFSGELSSYREEQEVRR